MKSLDADKSRDQILGELAVSRANEEKHRSLFETMAQGVVYQDAEGHLLSANPAAERILGLSLDQMQDRTSTDPRWKAIHEDGADFPGETHPCMVALRTGKLVHHVVMGIFNPKTDAHTWISVDAIPQFMPGQETPFQVYTIFEDITERREAETELRKAAVYLDAMGDALWVLDAKMNVVKVNKAAIALWGYDTKEETLGLNLTDLFPESVLSQHYAKMKEAVDTGTLKRCESVALTRDGNEIPVMGMGTAMKDAGGELLGFVGVYRDITQRKRVEDALRESEERYRAEFENAAEGILVADIETRQFRHVNPAICRMLGYSEDELKQKKVDDIHPKDALEHVISEFKAQARGEKTLAEHIPCLRKDGTTIYTDINTTKVIVDGREWDKSRD
jgi:PAS domain S-box-containing protein